METTFLILIATATVISTIVTFAKPAYKQFKDYVATISIVLSFALGIVGAFAIRSYIPYELTTGGIVLLGLALGTGASVFYDLWKLIQNAGKSDLPKIGK